MTTIRTYRSGSSDTHYIAILETRDLLQVKNFIRTIHDLGTVVIPGGAIDHSSESDDRGIAVDEPDCGDLLKS
jgi:hypothetical protein